MVAAMAMLILSKTTALAALVSSIYTLVKIIQGELPLSLLGDNFLILFFTLASIISVMMVIGSHAFLPDNYNLDNRTFHVLRWSALLSICTNWLLIPLSLSVIHFYCQEYHGFKIEYYLKYESDLLFILLLWTFLLLGLTHQRLEFIPAILFFPVGMMIISCFNVNIYGITCILLLIYKLSTGMCFPSEALDSSPEISVIFREVTLTLIIIILMAGTTLKIINWNNDVLLQFANSYWMVLDEYVKKA